MKLLNSPSLSSTQASISFPHKGTPNTLVPSAKDLRRKLFPVRLAAVSLVSLAIGGLLGALLLPFLPEETVTAVLLSHIPGADTTSSGVTLPLQYLRLCITCAPFFLLLAVAGVTSFCNGVSTLVLTLSAIPQGCTLYLLYRDMLGGSILGSLWGEASNAPLMLCVLYTGWTLARLFIRILLSLSSAHMAEHFFDPETRLAEGQRGVSPLLARHLLICLIGAGAGMLSCGIYLFVINSL